MLTLDTGFFIDAASFIYSSEIYPTNIRARGMALSTTTYFLACIVSHSPEYTIAHRYLSVC